MQWAIASNIHPLILEIPELPLSGNVYNVNSSPHLLQPMTKEITISTRVTEELATQLDHLSQALGRTRSWILNQALETYVSNETEFLASVQQGLDDMAQGDVVDHAEVVADWSQKRSNSLS